MSNYAISIERDTAPAENDPRAYYVVASSSHIPSRMIAKVPPSRRTGRDRERWLGVAAGRESLATMLAAHFQPHGLTVDIFFKGSTIAVKVRSLRTVEAVASRM